MSPTLQPPLSPASVSLPPEPKGGGGTLARGWGVWGVPIPTTGEKLSTLCLQAFFHGEKLFFSISLSIIAFDWAETGGDSPSPPPPILIVWGGDNHWIDRREREDFQPLWEPYKLALQFKSHKSWTRQIEDSCRSWPIAKMWRYETLRVGSHEQRFLIWAGILEQSMGAIGT